MLAVTFTAGVKNIFNIYLPQHTTSSQINMVLTASMLILVLIIALDALRNWIKILKKSRGPSA